MCRWFILDPRKWPQETKMKGLGRGKANPKVYDWAGKIITALGKWGSVPLEPTEQQCRTYLYPEIRGSDLPTGFQSHWSRAAPGLLMNCLVFPGLHTPKNSCSGSPSYPTLPWKRSPEADKYTWCSWSEVWPGYTCALLVATATPGTKKVWCERSVGYILHNI